MPPPPPLLHHHHHHSLLLPISITTTLLLLLLILTLLLYFKLSTKKQTSPTPPTPQTQPHNFPFSLLNTATSSFSPSNRVGQGGFGSVYKATLPSGLKVAVKLIDSTPNSLHELALASKIDTRVCPYIVSILGFSRGGRGKMGLVYEYMENGSLQDCLLERKCVELMSWGKRFGVIIGVAKGLEYLHHECDPVIVHGDIKPSNVLLDLDFEARIADFGLAQVLSKDVGIEEEGGNGKSNESCVVMVGEGEGASLNEIDKSSVFSEGGVCDVGSVDSGYRRKGIGRRGGDWWWKQEGVSESGRIKDYVMEWLGSEIKKEGPRKDCANASTSREGSKVEKTKKCRRKFEWWMSMDEGKVKKDKKSKKPREWWKEEYCEELSKKKKKRGMNSGEMWWQRDDDEVPSKKKRKSGSIDWWLDGFSGEFRIGRRNSQDLASGDIPKSGGISSTPSMRGTVCYIAPEYGGGGQLSEKCDVYSFGVLLLVLVSGRRPLQVTASPMSEFERANLVSWARQLAHNGKLLDLVDPNIQALDHQQALLCITIGLLCLQRSPNKRPSMKDIVGMLSGESDTPHLPFEFSPSPPSNSPFKSRMKAP